MRFEELNKELNKELNTGDGISMPSPVLEQKETAKLIKNTKGYNWEIKIFPNGDDKAFLDRLEYLDNEFKKRFGNAE